MVDEKSQPYIDALEGVSETAELLVEELRMMAEGQGEYSRFIYMSPKIKGVWNAAADWIENSHLVSTH